MEHLGLILEEIQKLNQEFNLDYHFYKKKTFDTAIILFNIYRI